MPLGKFPDRVGPFQKWASGKVRDSKLSDSATPSRSSIRKHQKRRRRRKKKQDG